MGDCGLDGASPPKPLSHGFAFLRRLVLQWSVGREDFRSIDLLGSPITTVHDRDLRSLSLYHFDLLEHFRQGVPVVTVLRVPDRGDEHAAMLGHGQRGLGAKLILLVLLAFGHAVDVRLVEAVDLRFVLGLLREDLSVTREVLALGLSDFGGQLAFEFAHQATGNGFEPSHSAPRFFLSFGMLPPALCE